MEREFCTRARQALSGKPNVKTLRGFLEAAIRLIEFLLMWREGPGSAPSQPFPEGEGKPEA